MKILVIDDSRVMRQIIIRTLRQAGLGGHDVVEASDGREGLAAVATHGPDLVLSDWNMPRMNGLDLLATLQDRGDTVPFAFVTSENTPEMVRRAVSAGALTVITKPFTVEDFRARLGTALQQEHP